MAARKDDPILATVTAYVGAMMPEDIGFSVREVTVTDDKTPFLAHLVNGHKLLNVEVKGVKLTLGGREASSFTNKHVDRLNLLIHKTSRILVKVSTPWPRRIPEIAPLPSAAAAERQFRACEETLDGFPKKRPRITLTKALEIVNSDG